MEDASWHYYQKDDFNGTHRNSSGREIKGPISTLEWMDHEDGDCGWIERPATKNELAARIEYFTKIKNEREKTKRLRALRLAHQAQEPLNGDVTAAGECAWPPLYLVPKVAV